MTVYQAMTHRHALKREWRHYSELELKWKFCNGLKDRKIPHIAEFRIIDWEVTTYEYLAIDIAVFKDDGEPLIAVELKNTDSRQDTWQGLGQAMTYKYSGFPHSALVTFYDDMELIKGAAGTAGVSILSPWQLLDYIDAIYRNAGCMPSDGCDCRHPEFSSFEGTCVRTWDERILRKSAGDPCF